MSLKRALTVLLLLTSACQVHVRPAIAVTQVEALTVNFSEPGVGQLHFRVPVQRDDVLQISWALGLDGRPFASGVEARPTVLANGLEVTTPLSYRHLGWADGARFERVRLRGEVRCRTLPDLVPFEGEAEVLVQGGPRLNAPRE